MVFFLLSHLVAIIDLTYYFRACKKMLWKPQVVHLTAAPLLKGVRKCTDALMRNDGTHFDHLGGHLYISSQCTPLVNSSKIVLKKNWSQRVKIELKINISFYNPVYVVNQCVVVGFL